MRITLYLFCVVLLAGCNLGTTTEDLPTDTPIPPTEVVLVTEAVTAPVVTDSPTAQPTATATFPAAADCDVPDGWYLYNVARGDTLGQIASRTNTTVNALVEANCLLNADLISVGQPIYVPLPLVNDNMTPRPVMGTVQVSPIIRNDGGWMVLGGGVNVTLVWDGFPQDSVKAEFYLTPTGTGTYDARVLIGTDNNLGDGIASIAWGVPTASISGHLNAVAYDSNDNEVAFSVLNQVYVEEVSTLQPPLHTWLTPAGGVSVDQMISGDAGHIHLLRDATATSKWEDAPSEALAADHVKFWVWPADWSYDRVGSNDPHVAIDENPADGISASWVIPPRLQGELVAVAYDANGAWLAVSDFNPSVSSSPAAGEGCIITPNETINYYDSPFDGNVMGTLTTNDSMAPLGRNLNGAWAISVDETQSGTGGVESLFWLPSDANVSKSDKC